MTKGEIVEKLLRLSFNLVLLVVVLCVGLALDSVLLLVLFAVGITINIIGIALGLLALYLKRSIDD